MDIVSCLQAAAAAAALEWLNFQANDFREQLEEELNKRVVVAAQRKTTSARATKQGRLVLLALEYFKSNYNKSRMAREFLALLRAPPLAEVKNLSEFPPTSSPVGAVYLARCATLALSRAR